VSTSDLASLFDRTGPLAGMTAVDLAKQLGIPLGLYEPVTPSVAYVAYVASADQWPVLPQQALHGLAGDVVRAIEPQSEADSAAILVQFLVAFGNVIGSGCHGLVGATRHSLNLFCVLVGESSKARKGTSWDHIKRIFECVDPGWTANRVTSGLSSAEGLINEVRDKRETTDEVYEPPDRGSWLCRMNLLLCCE
jgi:hypothetical protein